MRISVSPSIYSAIQAEADSLKRGFVLGVDAVLEQLLAVKQPTTPEPKESANGTDAAAPSV